MLEDIDLIYNGEERPSKAYFTPISNTKMSKPIGGLWTSPLDKSTGKSAWQDWCEREDFHPERYQTQWHIVPDKDAKTLTVDENLDNLQPYLIPDGYYGNIIDFEKLSKDYDVVRFPKEVVRKSYYELSSYDIDSTIFLTPKFTAMNHQEYKRSKADEAFAKEFQKRQASKDILTELKEEERKIEDLMYASLQPQENTPQETPVEIEQRVQVASQPQENIAREAPTEIKESEHVAQQTQENMIQETSPKKKNNLFNRLVKQKLWNKMFSR